MQEMSHLSLDHNCHGKLLCLLKQTFVVLLKMCCHSLLLWYFVSKAGILTNLGGGVCVLGKQMAFLIFSVIPVVMFEPRLQNVALCSHPSIHRRPIYSRCPSHSYNAIFLFPCWSCRMNVYNQHP